MDVKGYVYIADAGNHVISWISPTGWVTTQAGTGAMGSRDGLALEGSQFLSPSAVAVREDHNGGGENSAIILFVDDTANHRIRKIAGKVRVDKKTGEKIWSDVLVECFSGRCRDRPHSGFSDGPAHVARFDSPQGISVGGGCRGEVFFADTNNHLII